MAFPAPNSATIPYVTEQTFEQEILKSQLPVLIEFSATWCAPCKQVEPDLIALKQELEGKVKIVKIDVDKSRLLAQEFQIRGVPSFFVVNRGRVVAQQSGALRKQQLRTMLEAHLPRSESSVRVEELTKLLKMERVVPVDTREKANFDRAHIPGAMHLPLAQVEEQLYLVASTGKAPVLYCRSGQETKQLAERLTEQGMPVAFLDGGFLAWEIAGNSIERST